MTDDEFLLRHRAQHEQQRNRQVLLWIVFAALFISVGLMVFIAFR